MNASAQTMLVASPWKGWWYTRNETLVPRSSSRKSYCNLEKRGVGLKKQEEGNIYGRLKNTFWRYAAIPVFAGNPAFKTVAECRLDGSREQIRYRSHYRQLVYYRSAIL